MASPQTLQLDRLARELKCSICLSLFKQASSLSCNHTFCTSCILESMKRSPTCPLCKVPTTRREVRPAPQMDNLVSIFVTMGDAAGLDIVASQAAPAEAELDMKKLEATNDVEQSGKRGALSNITNRVKKSGRKTKGRLNSPKGKSLAKKRVQVPFPSSLKGELGLSSAQKCEFSDTLKTPRLKPLPYKAPGLFDSGSPALKRCSVLHPEKNAVSHSPNITLRNETSETKHCSNTRDFSIEDELPSRSILAATEDNDLNVQPKNSIVEIDSGRRDLEPFFWLKDETSQDCHSDAVQVTQESESFLVEQPNFSDLKDSDDDLSDATASDNEEINCTQLPLRGLNLHSLRDKDPLASTSDSISNREGQEKPNHISQDSASKKELSSSHGRKNKRGPQHSLQSDGKRRVSGDVSIDQATVDRPDEGSKKSEAYVPDGDSRKAEEVRGIKRKGKEGKANRGLGKRGRCGKADAIEIENEAMNDIIIGSAKGREKKKEKTNAQVSFSIEQSNGDSRSEKKNVTELSKKKEKTNAQVSFSIEQSNGDSRSEKKNVSELSKTETSAPHGCVFCGDSECSGVAGPMKYYNRKGVPVQPQNMTTDSSIILAHSNCAEWAPNVYFVGDIAKNLTQESLRGQKIKCTSCGKKGAALGCCLKRCKKSYHYPCARAEACKWNEEEFIMLCSEHASAKFPVKGKRPSSDSCSPSIEKACPTTNQAKENGSCSTAAAQQWQCATTNKWVLCGSALDNKAKEQLAAFGKLTGATVTKVWSSNVTHVIAGTDEHGAARRTLKFLLAILQGKWILKLDWLKACVEAGKPVNEEEFEIQSDIHGTVQGPKQGRLRASSEVSKLFEDFQFYFMADFLPAYKSDLQVLVAAGGGVVLHRKPLMSVSDTTKKHTLILYNNETPASTSKVAASEIMKRRQTEAKELGMQVNAHVLPHEWILESIASSKLHPLA